MNLFEKHTLSFNDYLAESENKTDSMKNYIAYKNGSEPLKVAFITHKEGDSAFDFVNSQVKRDLWVVPRKHWDDVLKNHRKALFDVIEKNQAKN